MEYVGSVGAPGNFMGTLLAGARALPPRFRRRQSFSPFQQFKAALAPFGQGSASPWAVPVCMIKADPVTEVWKKVCQ